MGGNRRKKKHKAKQNGHSANLTIRVLPTGSPNLTNDPSVEIQRQLYVLSESIATQLQSFDSQKRVKFIESLLTSDQDQIVQHLDYIIFSIRNILNNITIPYTEIHNAYDNIIKNNNTLTEKHIEQLKAQESVLLKGFLKVNVWSGIRILLDKLDQKHVHSAYYDTVIDNVMLDLPQSTTQLFLRYGNRHLSMLHEKAFQCLKDKFDFFKTIKEYYQHYLTLKQDENYNFFRAYDDYCELYQCYLTFLYSQDHFEELLLQSKPLKALLDSIANNNYQQPKSWAKSANSTLVTFIERQKEAQTRIESLLTECQEQQKVTTQFVSALHTSLKTTYDVNWTHKSQTLQTLEAAALTDDMRQTINIQLNKSWPIPITGFNSALAYLAHYPSLQNSQQELKQFCKLTTVLKQFIEERVLPIGAEHGQELSKLINEMLKKIRKDYQNALTPLQRENNRPTPAILLSQSSEHNDPEFNKIADEFADHLADQILGSFGDTPGADPFTLATGMVESFHSDITPLFNQLNTNQKFVIHENLTSPVKHMAERCQTPPQQEKTPESREFQQAIKNQKAAFRQQRNILNDAHEKHQQDVTNTLTKAQSDHLDNLRQEHNKAIEKIKTENQKKLNALEKEIQKAHANELALLQSKYEALEKKLKDENQTNYIEFKQQLQEQSNSDLSNLKAQLTTLQQQEADNLKAIEKEISLQLESDKEEIQKTHRLGAVDNWIYNLPLRVAA